MRSRLRQDTDDDDGAGKAFRLRGHIFTDAEGRYASRPIVTLFQPTQSIS
jgi:protocatechuate 3,4-dioxygenase beta subunit